MTEQEAPFAVLHIPHASTFISDEVRASFCVDGASLADELLEMTDWFTDELFGPDERLAKAVMYPVSRLVVDPERFENDEHEPMASRGMGVIYTHTSRHSLLRNPLDALTREQLLHAHYRPHHERLTSAVDAALTAWNSCLVVDCHSFGSMPKAYEFDQSLSRPDICIGTDAYHSPRALIDAAEQLFVDAGFRVALDRPFSGAMVPSSHYRRDSRVMALMVEVNRGLYMDERSGQRLPAFGEVRDRIQTVVRGIVSLASH